MQRSRQGRALPGLVALVIMFLQGGRVVEALSSSNKPSAAAANSISFATIRRQIRALYAGYPDRYPDYQRHLHQAFSDYPLLDSVVALTDDLNHFDPACVDYIIYNPAGMLQDFTPYINLKAVFNLQAGTDAVARNPTLSPSIPLTRMMDAGLREGMVEYVVGHVLRYHLQTDQQWENNNRQGQQNWGASSPGVLARQCRVGMLGLGALGQACATALANLNFDVWGWSRTAKHVNGIHCLYGKDSLATVLERSDILVLLLPDTVETRGIINKVTLAQCKEGVYLINAGRGSSIVETDLLLALDSQHVAGATLDVFETEPLPAGHPFWQNPRVLVTPHVAAKSRASTAAVVVAENMYRAETGQALLYQVDRAAGY